ncbi:asparagine synthase-related protein [Rubrivivax gelatinosus]|uniref:asparagine synthase (glutamine-hydrolyzing) n=1 Tax=Rubrivivax gelatinosus (strain NBRC 100245 / IL144) TaxID=983917 RepID=I0HM05_RUBGI|nr:asparagine synthase C-terminal domain-containing protein [Rubrivivax gelatinosus]BAL94042.1 putative asparagine synthase [Rubrivivax gelatinosus IL144]
MFRYVAFVWDATCPPRVDAAARLAQSLAPHWQAAHRQPGLQVHVTGSPPGHTRVHLLRERRGVVIGTLFRRDDGGGAPLPSSGLDAAESDRIAHGGGRALVQDFWGRYVAFLCTEGGRTRLLRDPSGALPCYLLRHEGVWIVCSWLEDALALLPATVGFAVNWPAVAAQLLIGEPGGRDTALFGVQQVAPGEAIDLAHTASAGELLWDATSFARQPLTHGPDMAVIALRETVQACASAWAGCHDRVLFRLSGGVDSSILLSCLSRGRTHTHVTCVNYHSAGADGDERRYARLAANSAGFPLVERERNTDFRLQDLLTIARTPTPGNYVGRLSARADAELAAEYGSGALFTGAGGDQLFFEFGRPWPAADYLHCRGLDFGFPAAAMDAARLGRVSVWSAMAYAFRQRLRPTRLLDDPRPPLLGPAVPDDRTRLQQFLHPALRDGRVLPIGKQVQTRALLHPAPFYDPFQRQAAPELVNPLLSQPLIELCLRLPTWVLTHGGRGRALARRAFADELPPEIRTRRAKGGMEELLQAVLLRNLGFAKELLLDGELARRGLLDRARLEQALSDRPTTLAAHVSQLHVYLGIEAWLAQWTSASPCANRQHPPAHTAAAPRPLA